MNLKSATFSLLFLLFVLYSCSEEKIPADLVGSWDVELLEIENCQDTFKNVFVNFADTSCYERDSTAIVCIQSYNYEFNASPTTYIITRTQTVDGTTETFEEKGNYTIENLNRLVLCHPECDSLFVVRSGLILEIVDIDTLSGCGQVVRAKQGI